VGSAGTHQTGHVAGLFSANQIRGLKSVRQIIEVKIFLKNLAGSNNVWDLKFKYLTFF